MNEKQEYISIKFDLKPPKDIRHSIINTIVLLLRDIANMEDYKQWEHIDTVILNDNIEKIKQELDNLKIIEIKGGIRYDRRRERNCNLFGMVK